MAVTASFRTYTSHFMAVVLCSLASSKLALASLSLFLVLLTEAASPERYLGIKWAACPMVNPADRLDTYLATSNSDTCSIGAGCNFLLTFGVATEVVLIVAFFLVFFEGSGSLSSSVSSSASSISISSISDEVYPVSNLN